MKNALTFCALFVIAARSCLAAIVVPGLANPQLAGAPDGLADPWSGDSAPANSPILVTGKMINAGAILNFAASGVVQIGPEQFLSPPDGYIPEWNPPLSFPPFNGISGIKVPFAALIGVFLSDAAPNSNSTPPTLNFDDPLARDYVSISPALCQLFVIGDGRTSDARVQSVTVPVGATRLFLGVSDTGHFNNLGSYTVDIQAAMPLTVDIALYPGITVYGTVGKTNRIDFITQLGATNWMPLTNFILSSSPYLFIDTTIPMPMRRFYRAVELE